MSQVLVSPLTSSLMEQGKNQISYEAILGLLTPEVPT